MPRVRGLNEQTGWRPKKRKRNEKELVVTLEVKNDSECAMTLKQYNTYTYTNVM